MNNLRLLTRCSAVLAAALTAAAAIATVVAPGAGALEQERIVVEPDTSKEYVMDAIVGTNPGGTVDSSTVYQPDVCAGPAGCDLVPITVTPVGDPDSEYFVTIEVHWDTVKLDNAPALGQFTVTNDIDVYMQNDPMVEGAGPDEDGYTYKSATSSMPERIVMYKPQGDWNLLVVNYNGANTGYKLKISSSTDEIPGDFFESLPPEFRGGGTPGPLAITTPDPVVETPAEVEVPVAPADLSLDAPPLPDSSFSSGFDDSPALDDQLSAPEVEVPAARAAAVRVAPPSGLALLLWLLAVPLIVVAVGGALLLRNQARLLAV